MPCYARTHTKTQDIRKKSYYAAIGGPYVDVVDGTSQKSMSVVLPNPTLMDGPRVR
jgi:hypothetical protein